ncbi:hypothetical protein P171DRAFT_487380 [Karstenula rhodostoma CBS 690.94]|uniref:Uncharacterized protein n=1 Tax=Karstenula rhodostoma CBS 690.94 TaxID=1392251 RepID=A0A9P4PDZ8_9PLEO|nr:hypothetical protein P171DRAFT_487380 [Karstenula rhodostoma CBS 690.94]
MALFIQRIIFNYSLFARFCKPRQSTVKELGGMPKNKDFKQLKENDSNTQKGMSDSTKQAIATLEKCLDDLHKDSAISPGAPSFTPPDASNDPTYLQMRNILDRHWRLIKNLEIAVGELQLRYSEPRVVTLPPRTVQALQEEHLQGIRHLEQRFNIQEGFKNRAQTLMKGHEDRFSMYDRRIRDIVLELEKCKTRVVALQEAVDKEVVFASQKAIHSASPQDLQNGCQDLGGSGSVNKVIEYGPVGILLRTLHQRLKTVECELEGSKTREAPGDRSNDSSDSTSAQLSKTLEDQPLETLGLHLLESLGHHLMADINQQLKSLGQQTSENLEQLEQRLLATMRHRILEIIEQSLSAAMEQRLLTTVEQRLVEFLEHIPSNLLETQVLKSIEQRCMEFLKFQLTKTLKLQFEKLDNHLKERAHATRTLVKSRMSNLEGRMLPALHEKGEQVEDLQSTQKSMSQMLETLGERVEVLEGKKDKLEEKKDELEEKKEEER